MEVLTHGSKEYRATAQDTYNDHRRKEMQRSSQVHQLQSQIRRILRDRAQAVDPATLDFFLKQEEIGKGHSITVFDTYKVRDALAALERDGKIEFTPLGEVRLIQE